MVYYQIRIAQADASRQCGYIYIAKRTIMKTRFNIYVMLSVVALSACGAFAGCSPVDDAETSQISPATQASGNSLDEGSDDEQNDDPDDPFEGLDPKFASMEI
jgi:hypothetical protein